MTARKKTKAQRVSGIRSLKDRREALETIVRAFTGPEGLEKHMKKGLWRKPVYDPEHTRVTVADGRVTAAVVMAPRTIRFGPAQVPAMTVGPVATHDHYRKRGYVSAAMNDASRYMEEHGILAAYLQGIADFYHRFGYYPFMAPSRAHLNRNEAKKEASKGKLRAARRNDFPVLKKLYERGTRRRICAAVREDKVWEWLAGPAGRTWLFRSPRLILDDGGEVCGYLTSTPREGEFFVREMIVKPDETSFRTALGALVREAKRLEAKSVSLPLPLDDPFALFLKQYVRTDFKLQMNPTGGALMKIVNFPALVQALEPLLDQRWKQARTSLKPVEFTLKSETGSVRISAGRSGVRVGGTLKGARKASLKVSRKGPREGSRVNIPQRWLSGLLTGYHILPEIIDRKGVRCPRALGPAMDVLFPRCHPFVYQGDNY